MNLVVVKFFTKAATAIITVAALLVLATPPAYAQHESVVEPLAEPVAEVEELELERAGPATHERFGMRLGFLMNGLAGAEEQRVWRYFDLGFRYKAGEYYFDFRAPALTILIDLLIMVFVEVTMDRWHDPFIERFNDYGMPNHWELGHARLGYRFRLSPPHNFRTWTEPIDVALGIFGTADLVVFEMRRDIDRDRAQELGYLDPFVLGVGGFMALGNTYDGFQYDVALSLGMAVRGEDENPDRRVLIAALDADFNIDVSSRFAFYVRPRLTGYFTRLSPRSNIGTGLSGGINMRF